MAGICSTVPNSAAANVPETPDLSPIILVISSFGMKVNNSPINKMMLNTVGRILNIDDKPIFSDSKVLLRFLIVETNKQIITKVLITIAVNVIILLPLFYKCFTNQRNPHELTTLNIV
jgi:hypothetical protein